MDEKHVAAVPDVAVVIPCHDVADTIGEQLSALAHQDYGGTWEVVLADNRSADDLAGAIAPFSGHVPGLRIVPAPERLTPGYARNVGVRHTRADRILFCDGDDVMSSGWVNAMLAALEGAPMITGHMEFRLLNSAAAAASRGEQTAGLPNKFGFLPHGFGGNCAVLREVHEAIGGYDESMPSLEDADYFWRAQLAGYEVAHAPDAVIHYRLRPGSKGILRQAIQYAAADVLLHKRYRVHGLSRLRMMSGIKGWIRVMLSLPGIVSAEGRSRLAWRLGYRLGRLRGALKYRTLAL